MNSFVHLHVHSHYSFMEGICDIRSLITRAVEFSMPALALTDHGRMHGAAEFYRIATREGIKPILGCELDIHPISRTNEQQKESSKPCHIVLLARNNEGYQNLLQLVSLASCRQNGRFTPVAHEDLQKYARGLTALSACMKGEIPRLILQDRLEDAEHLASSLVYDFGPDNFYLELQDHGLPEHKKINRGLAEIAQNKGIPMVATNNVRYLEKNDSPAYNVLRCIDQRISINEPHSQKYNSSELYLKSPEEMHSLFNNYPSAVENSLRIAEACQVEMFSNKFYTPGFSPTPKGKDEGEYLRELCLESLSRHYSHVDDYLQKRLDYELEVIERQELSGFLIILADIVQYAQDRGILITSCTGTSLVSYCLGISMVDPLAHKLILEQSFNRNENQLITLFNSLSIAESNKDELWDYVVKKYGEERVTLLIDFESFPAPFLLMEVGWVLGTPRHVVDNAIKFISSSPAHNVTHSLRHDNVLQTYYENQEEYRLLLDTARSLENLPRYFNKDNSSIVIGETPLTRHVPLQKDDSGNIIIQYPQRDNLEEIPGFQRFEFHDSKELSILNNVLDKIISRQGKKIDLRDIPLDDKPTYDMFARGIWGGLYFSSFIFEGLQIHDGIRYVLQELQPDKFEDIIATLVLCREPVNWNKVYKFVSGKHGRKPANYFHPALQDILEETYGIIVYKEQVMQIVSRIGGFTYADAIEMIRALEKKHASLINNYQEKLISETVQKGYPEELAKELFYYFERTHNLFHKDAALSQALLAYWLTFMMANYEEEFMEALESIYN